MEFDYLAAFEQIKILLPGGEPLSAKMATLIRACETQYPHKDWAAFRRLPYDADASRLAIWLPEVFKDEPPKSSLAGLWFGLFNPALEDGSASADFHITGSASFDADDGTFEWAAQADYVPAAGDARSEVLASLYAAAYASDGALGNAAEYPLSLGYTAFVVADVLRRVAATLGWAGTAGVAAGFDSGDGLLVGRLTETEFVVQASAA